MDYITNQLKMADRLSAITQRVGFSLWQIQELEGVSAQYFVLLTQARKGMNLAEGNALVERAQAKTLGATIGQITKAGLLSAEVETRFTALLAERNWLVHRSRADSRNAVHDDKAMITLVTRLDALADEATALLKAVGVLVEQFVQQHGVSAQYIDKMSAHLLKQWHTADSS